MSKRKKNVLKKTAVQLPLPVEFPVQSEIALITALSFKILDLTEIVNEIRRGQARQIQNLQSVVKDVNTNISQLMERISGNEIRLMNIESKEGGTRTMGSGTPGAHPSAFPQRNGFAFPENPQRGALNEGPAASEGVPYDEAVEQLRKQRESLKRDQ